MYLKTEPGGNDPGGNHPTVYCTDTAPWIVHGLHGNETLEFNSFTSLRGWIMNADEKKTWGAQATKPRVPFPQFLYWNASEISEESFPWGARSSQAEFLFNLSSTSSLFNFFLKLLQNPFGLKMDVRAKPLNNGKDALNNFQSHLEEVRVLIHQEPRYLCYLLISTVTHLHLSRVRDALRKEIHKS